MNVSPCNEKRKVALLSMDVEAIYDTRCVADRKIVRDPALAGYAGIGRFLSLCEKHGARATLFVLTSALPDTKEVLREAASRGHEIALHGKDHLPPVSLSTEALSAMLDASKEQLSRETGVPVRGYRAPCFAIDERVSTAVREKNFLYDASAMNFSLETRTEGIDLSAYEKRASCVYEKDGFFEIPPCLEPTAFGRLPISGGGYLRLIPWFVAKFFLVRYLKREDAFVFYVHPFELSDEPLPKMPGLKFLERLYFSHNRKRYLARVEKILRLLEKYGYRYETFSDLALSMR